MVIALTHLFSKTSSHLPWIRTLRVEKGLDGFTLNKEAVINHDFVKGKMYVSGTYSIHPGLVYGNQFWNHSDLVLHFFTGA